MEDGRRQSVYICEDDGSGTRLRWHRGSGVVARTMARVHGVAERRGLRRGRCGGDGVSRCTMRVNGEDDGTTSWRRQCTWRTGRMTARAHRPDDGAGRGGEIAWGREIARGGDLAAIDDVATGASTGRQTVDDPLLLLLHYTTRKK